LAKSLNEAAEIVPELKAELPQLITDLRRVSWKIERSLQRADRMVASANTAAEAVPVTTAKLNAAIDKVSPGLDDLGRTFAQSDEATEKLINALSKFEGFNEASLRRLLREEGVLVRLKPQRKKD
jgi:ABC-type transporter Mla subunit MlaD